MFAKSMAANFHWASHLIYGCDLFVISVWFTKEESHFAINEWDVPSRI